MPSLVRAFAPSKVNLALSVGAPGADGMHPISSWMVTTRFGDDLALKRLPPGTPSRYAIEWHDDARRRTEIDWRLAKDLAVRAHRALEERLGRELPVQMRLQKRIPVGEGSEQVQVQTRIPPAKWTVPREQPRVQGSPTSSTQVQLKPVRFSGST